LGLTQENYIKKMIKRYHNSWNIESSI
jgi:hypothetical protein